MLHTSVLRCRKQAVLTSSRRWAYKAACFEEVPLQAYRWRGEIFAVPTEDSRPRLWLQDYSDRVEGPKSPKKTPKGRRSAKSSAKMRMLGPPE
ncbi:hypothetical protein AFLA_002133 [Aspergillus flavus NRRL3357]|nr:hypothetical protein AFLA_002133 [Aspergillus flavus NRRL3357]